MADEQPKSTRLIRIIQSPNFESKRMGGTVVEQSGPNTFFLTFYVERPAFEQTFRMEFTGGIPSGNFLDTKFEPATILEIQQGILLDLKEARTLRDQLNKVLPQE